ncbi:MAG: hypothetical protein IJP24_01010 [Firmicutes bacterium]|nr:hypothetical protein [Bacillota bacterium]
MDTNTATSNLSIIYGIIAFLSFAMLIAYRFATKKREKWLMLLFAAVTVVNLGYYLIAISDTLEFALMANRIAYLGSVFLPLSMLMAILKACNIDTGKKVQFLLLAASIVVFAIAASPGILDVYYKSVELVFVNGMAKLEKEYGIMHPVYLVYLLSYFAAMIFSIVYAIASEKIRSSKHAIILLTIVFLNIAIWFIERFIYWNFEFLSISYLISELLLVMLYSMLQDYGIVPGEAKLVVVMNESKKKEQLPEEIVSKVMNEWPAKYNLTSREADVLKQLLINNRRKDIAENLHVSEHTIKKHTANIFMKTEVTSRTELFNKAKEEYN